MAFRVIFLLCCTALSIAWNAPATLADTLVRKLSDSNLALLSAEGSLWSGTALLAAPDKTSGRFVPFMEVKWTWHPSFLLRGELHWAFESGGNSPGSIGLGFGGPKVEMLKIGMPARYAMERIPHAIGKIGWRGDIQLFVQRWHCGWQGKCSGDTTLRGDIQIDARGTFQAPQRLELAGTISGDPAFVGRLPSIAGGFVTPDGAPGRMKFSVRP
ncbi:MAG: type II secretion system protein N [Uliginosibacterium sp.]|nr:type II secretion system protein N [Uliginosibacterium sp.]